MVGRASTADAAAVRGDAPFECHLSHDRLEHDNLDVPRRRLTDQARHQGTEHGGRSEKASAALRQRGPALYRRIVGAGAPVGEPGGSVGQARHRRQDDVIGDELRVRAGVPERGDARDGQPGMALEQRLTIQTQGLTLLMAP